MHCVGIGKAATNGAPNSENSGNFLAMKMKSDHHPTFTTTPICDLALSDGGSLDALRAVLQPLQQNGAKSVGFSLRPGKGSQTLKEETVGRFLARSANDSASACGLARAA